MYSSVMVICQIIDNSAQLLRRLRSANKEITNGRFGANGTHAEHGNPIIIK